MDVAGAACIAELTLVPESEYAYLKDGSKTFSDLWTPVSGKLIEIYQNYTQKNPAVTYQQVRRTSLPARPRFCRSARTRFRRSV